MVVAFEDSRVLVDLFIRTLLSDSSSIAGYILFGFYKGMCDLYRFSNLPISFAVKLVCSDEYSATLIIGVKKNKICRDSLVGFDLYYLSYLDFGGLDILKACTFQFSILDPFLPVLLAIKLFVSHKPL